MADGILYQHYGFLKGRATKKKLKATIITVPMQVYMYKGSPFPYTVHMRIWYVLENLSSQGRTKKRLCAKEVWITADVYRIEVSCIYPLEHLVL